VQGIKEKLLDELRSKADSQSSAAQALAQASEGSEQKLRAANARVAQRDTTIKELRTRLTALTASLTERDQQLAELDALKAKERKAREAAERKEQALKALRSKLEAAEAGADDFKAQCAQWEKTSATLLAEIKALKAKVKDKCKPSVLCVSSFLCGMH
jgi:chromosome segregation ATPase